jgi:DHA2 family methylenomycin A resistance protein-like MFS transporter
MMVKSSAFTIGWSLDMSADSPSTAVRVEPTPASRQWSGLSLGLLCTGMFIVYLDTTITPVALPAIRHSFGGGVANLQWVLDAYVLTFACVLLTAGSLGDVIGRKRVFLLGLGGFTVASLGCALAANTGELIAARAAQGICAAAVVPVSLAVISDLYPDPAARTRAVSIWAGLGGVAMAAGPLAGGLLVQYTSWRAIFWINVPIGVVVFAVLLSTLPALTTSRTRQVDVLGQLVFIIATAGLTYALIEGNRQGWGSPAIITSFVVAFVAFVFFASWELRNRDPMLPPRLLAHPVVAATSAVNFLGLFGLYATLFLLTLFLQQLSSLSAITTGLRFLALTAALGVSAIVSPKVAQRIGNRVAMVIGSVMVAIGLTWLVTLQVGTGFGEYWWALGLIGFGVPLSSGAVAVAALMASVPLKLVGTASGTMNTFRQLGALVGVALAGALLPRHGDPMPSMHVTFVIAAVGALLGAVVIFYVLRPRPASEPTGTEA